MIRRESAPILGGTVRVELKCKMELISTVQQIQPLRGSSGLNQGCMHGGPNPWGGSPPAALTSVFDSGRVSSWVCVSTYQLHATWGLSHSRPPASPPPPPHPCFPHSLSIPKPDLLNPLEVVLSPGLAHPNTITQLRRAWAFPGRRGSSDPPFKSSSQLCLGRAS